METGILQTLAYVHGLLYKILPRSMVAPHLTVVELEFVIKMKIL